MRRTQLPNFCSWQKLAAATDLALLKLCCHRFRVTHHLNNQADAIRNTKLFHTEQLYTPLQRWFKPGWHVMRREFMLPHEPQLLFKLSHTKNIRWVWDQVRCSNLYHCCCCCCCCWLLQWWYNSGEITAPIRAIAGWARHWINNTSHSRGSLARWSPGNNTARSALSSRAEGQGLKGVQGHGCEYIFFFFNPPRTLKH